MPYILHVEPVDGDDYEVELEANDETAAESEAKSLVPDRCFWHISVRGDMIPDGTFDDREFVN